MKEIDLMDGLLRRKNVPTIINFLSGNPADWFGFTKIKKGCGLSDTELDRLLKFMEEDGIIIKKDSLYKINGRFLDSHKNITVKFSDTYKINEYKSYDLVHKPNITIYGLNQEIFDPRHRDKKGNRSRASVFTPEYRKLNFKIPTKELFNKDNLNIFETLDVLIKRVSLIKKESRYKFLKQNFEATYKELDDKTIKKLLSRYKLRLLNRLNNEDYEKDVFVEISKKLDDEILKKLSEFFDTVISNTAHLYPDSVSIVIHGGSSIIYTNSTILEKLKVNQSKLL